MNIQNGKYTAIDLDNARFLGFRSQKDGVLAGDMRCLLCGRWFSWSKANIKNYILQRRWDATRNEPSHCGSSHCDDYHRRYIKHMSRLVSKDQEYIEKWAWKKFNQLKQSRLVA